MTLSEENSGDVVDSQKHNTYPARVKIIISNFSYNFRVYMGLDQSGACVILIPQGKVICSTAWFRYCACPSISGDLRCITFEVNIWWRIGSHNTFVCFDIPKYLCWVRNRYMYT